jgi:hypothetical protein
MMTSAQAQSTTAGPARTAQLREVIARSNHFMIARMPASWIFWFAMPHEVWHYLAARALRLRTRLVPGMTLFEPTTRWKSIFILMAPATVGLLWPLACLPLLQCASHFSGSVNWALATVTVMGWWAGCAGDFIDSWLLLRREEKKSQHQARMRRMLDRFIPELAYVWQTPSE